MNFQFPLSEKSFASIESLGMLDHSNLNIYERDALNAALENMLLMQ